MEKFYFVFSVTSNRNFGKFLKIISQRIFSSRLTHLLISRIYIFHNPTQQLEAAVYGCSVKGCSEKIHKYYKKTPAQDSLRQLQGLDLQLVKKGLQQRFFCKVCKIVRCIHLAKQLLTTSNDVKIC